jgi:hypothetical protein
MRKNQPDLFPGTSRFRTLNGRYGNDDVLYFDVAIEIPANEMTAIQERLDIASREMTKRLNKPVKIKVDVIPFQEFESRP